MSGSLKLNSWLAAANEKTGCGDLRVGAWFPGILGGRGHRVDLLTLQSNVNS
ncbi:hypothetical protein PISMIDRAFT_18569 [Pisolithus microcarpus 441]|uniref:Unplaced genomic scaffold scaffold_374, whole genome shotgun sequence n=1 Tax=Pisolithus microcarpus 441 TaxID=765257 RepID=A0A0C9Y6W6_9AGAM|nr:hypothetical protein PISMIDRAFT_18569 [Pisolithus microcarpus 441]